MEFWRWAPAMVVVGTLCALACAEDDDDGSVSPGGHAGQAAEGGTAAIAMGGAGDSGSGGMSLGGTGDMSLGGHGESGAAQAGRANVAGEGGEAGAGGEPPLLPPVCGVDSPRVLNGIVAGELIETQVIAQSSANYSPGFHIVNKVGTGFAIVWGPGSFYDETVPTPSYGVGILRLPAGGALADEVLCSNEMVAKHYGNRYGVQFSELSPLGACSDAVSTGSLSGCIGPGSGTVQCQSGQARFLGDIDGTSIDLRAKVLGLSNSSDRTTWIFENGGLFMATPYSGSAIATLVIPSDSAVLPGAVICVAMADMNPAADRGSYAFTLDELGVLGACPGTPVSGVLNGCF